MPTGLLLTEDSARRLQGLLDDRSNDPPKRRPPHRKGVRQIDWILARITGWAALGSTGARWKYSGEEVELNNDDFQVRSGGLVFALTGTPPTYLLNLTEAFNVSQHFGVQGNSVNQGGSAYPTGFSLKPVGAGAGGVVANRVVVRAWFHYDTQGNLRYVFSYNNADDGVCP